jgi:hypothetical protein
MTASDAFDLFFADLSSRVKELGLRRSGRSIRKNFNYGRLSIKFQKSTKSSSAVTLFTADVTIAHELVSRKLDGLEFPYLAAFQYSERLGYFRDKSDFWWTLSSNSEVKGVSSEICSIISNLVLPEFSRPDFEASLVSMWQSARCPGMTERQCNILLAAYYSCNSLREQLNELRVKVEKTDPSYVLSMIDRLLKDLE